MNLTHNIFKATLFICIALVYACSGGPVEKKLPDSLTSPAYLLDQGIQEYNNNDYENAIITFEKVLMQYRSIDNQVGIAKSCLNLANAYMAINNTEMAEKYLFKAETIINRASLHALDDHLHLLKSSLAIKNSAYEKAIEELNSALKSKNKNTQLAALKNRTNIAFQSHATDRQVWLQQYKTLQQSGSEPSMSHLASIYRFEAVLENDSNKQKLLFSKSLNISRNLADRPAIAATLTQWATFDIKNNRLDEAEDKSVRALFIRHQLGDVKNSLLILQQLSSIYIKTNNEKHKKTEIQINELLNNNMKTWDTLFNIHDNYPD